MYFQYGFFQSFAFSKSGCSGVSLFGKDFLYETFGNQKHMSKCMHYNEIYCIYSFIPLFLHD